MFFAKQSILRKLKRRNSSYVSSHLKSFFFVGVVFAKNDSGLWRPDIVVYNNSCLNTTTVVFNQAPDDFNFRNYRVFVTDQGENPTPHVSVPYISTLKKSKY